MSRDLRAGTEGLELVHLREPFLDAAEDEELRSLLALCFTGPGDGIFLRRRYHLEPPEERWMARGAGGALAAHVALRERVVRAGASRIAVGGVSEVCVHPDHRGRGLARRLLSLMHEELRRRSVPFALLFGEEGIYGSSGYRPVKNIFRYWQPVELRWVEETVEKALVCELSDVPWPAGTVDLRGILF